MPKPKTSRRQPEVVYLARGSAQNSTAAKPSVSQPVQPPKAPAPSSPKKPKATAPQPSKAPAPSSPEEPRPETPQALEPSQPVQASESPAVTGTGAAEAVLVPETPLVSSPSVAPQPSQPAVLSRLVYIKRESPISITGVFEAGSGVKVAQFGSIVRAIGVVEGTITAFDSETNKGMIDVAGHQIPFQHAWWRRGALSRLEGLINQQTRFSFWPTQEKPPENPTESQPKLPVLKLARARQLPTPEAGYVEAVGKLRRLWPGGFLISLWSQQRIRKYYVVFMGDCPYPDHLDHYLLVIGKFDPEFMAIRLQEAAKIEFVAPEDVQRIKAELRQQKQE